ncbi:Rv1733c family protein [Streptomyces sp. NPDC054770]
MPRTGYSRKLLWRWRNNPLRRRHDIVEAWIVLATWTVVAVGGTVTGLVTAHTADDMFARQRTERHSVRAELLNDVPRSTGALGGTDRRSASVRWTTPDGSIRTGRTLVSTGLKAGTKVTVWQDGQGQLALAPTGSAEAAIESGFLGTTAALALAGLVFGAGAVARWRLDCRRFDEWDREWGLVGPRWGHKTS